MPFDTCQGGGLLRARCPYTCHRLRTDALGHTMQRPPPSPSHPTPTVAMLQALQRADRSPFSADARALLATLRNLTDSTTLADLADNLGIAYLTLWRWHSDNRIPPNTWALLRRIALLMAAIRAQGAPHA